MEESIKGKRVELDKNRPNIISGLLNSVSVPSVLLQNELVLHSNSSLGAFCSSDASMDSCHSQALTGRMYRTSSTSG